MLILLAIMAYIYYIISGKGDFTPFEHVVILMIIGLATEVILINNKLQNLRKEKNNEKSDDCA